MIFHVVRLNHAPGRLRLALFDFDGTVSLLRSGWQELMVELATLVVPRRNGEGEAEIAAIARELVHRTNGQPTVYQMQAVADLVHERGGVPPEALVYKRLFLERLSKRVEPRLATIQRNTDERSTWLVPGVEHMLEEMQLRRIPCYLLSGTDQTAVRAETTALGLDRFFVGIFGATPDVNNSTKAAIVPRLAHEHHLTENELVAFGDGVEEIRLAKESGGIAVGIARDKTQPGQIDPAQCPRLIAAGADAIIADFRTHDQVIEYLFGLPG